MRLAVIYFSMLILISCKSIKDDGIAAGIVDKGVDYYEFNPAIVISPYKTDSVDVDNDTISDFIFTKTSIPILTTIGLEALVLKKEGVQIMMSAAGNYPACLNLNDRISSSSKWSDSGESQYIMQTWECTTENNTCYMIGTFVNVNDKYLAFRKGNLYGWILLDNISNRNLTLKGSAISK
jgi:hypothetical protein